MAVVGRRPRLLSLEQCCKDVVGCQGDSPAYSSNEGGNEELGSDHDVQWLSLSQKKSEKAPKTSLSLADVGKEGESYATASHAGTGRTHVL